MKNISFRGLLENRVHIFSAIIIISFSAFELFNFLTTQSSFRDLLGTLSFGPFTWATILSVAFCGIDLAGIARLFTPERGHEEPAEVYYLFGAWLLAAALNATLTWWGLSVAINTNLASGGAQASSALIGQSGIAKWAPILLAIVVFAIRILIVNAFSLWAENTIHAQSRPVSRPLATPRPTTEGYRPTGGYNPYPQAASSSERERPSAIPVGRDQTLARPVRPSADALPTYRKPNGD